MSPTIVAIDATGMTAAVRTALEYSGRVPTVAISTAGFFIARKAVNLTRRADIGQIDSSLGVTVAPLLVTRGPRKGLPLKSRRRKYIVPEKSLAMWIILARLKPGSTVNVRENNRFKLDRATFSPGGGAAAFWQKVFQMGRDMVATRHKSIAFIASSMLPVIRDLEQYVPPKYRRGMPPRDSEVENAGDASLVPKGRATVSTSSNSAVMEGQALIGVGGVPDNLNDPHNEAMWQYLAPAIQIAVYDEEAKTLVYIAIKGEAEERRAKFSGSGVILDV